MHYGSRVAAQCCLLGFLLGLLQWPSWAVTTFALDQLTVDLNGAPLFVDNFDDGVAPPSSPTYVGGPLAPAPGYTVAGTFPGGTETGGKLTLSALNGIDAQTANGLDAKIQFGILRTPAVDAAPPAPARSINSTDTFKISGLYDLLNPDGRNEHYRVSVTDRTSPTTAGDVFSIAVMRAQFPSAPNTSAITPTYCGSVGGSCTDNIVGTSTPFTSLNGQVVVTIYKQDFVTNTLVFLEAIPVDVTGNPDQIRLTIEKAASGSPTLSTSFTYLKNGVELGTATPFLSSSSVFNYNNFTRADFAAVQRPTETTHVAATLTTASPASISQNISEVTSNSLQFQYRFATTSGQLRVTLNGVELGVIDAPTTLDPAFTTRSFDTSAFVGLTDIVLAFILDGLPGSSILLDNIIFGNLANGDFQTGNLSAWTAFASPGGFAGVEITVESVPLPGALPLFAAGLGMVALLARRRRKVGSGAHA
jgi:hypothetical protein